MQVSVTLFVPHSLHYCVPRSVMYSFQVAHRHSRVRLGGYSLLLFYVPLYSCMFFTLHITARFFFPLFFRFFSPYFIPNGLLFLYFFCIFRCFKAPPLRCLAEKLPEIVLGSRTDSTTLTYFNGFKRWRANAFYRHLAKVEFVAME